MRDSSVPLDEKMMSTLRLGEGWEELTWTTSMDEGPVMLGLSQYLPPHSHYLMHLPNTPLRKKNTMSTTDKKIDAGLYVQDQ